MKILAIDTSAEACSVAVSNDGDFFSRYETAPQQHAGLIMPMIEEVMQEAELKPTDLTGLAYGNGPGSFTGVRIAAGTIQGLALGLDLEVAGISTLQALAHRAWREHGYSNVIAALDARMQEVYVGSYRFDSEGLSECVIADAVCSPDAVAFPELDKWAGIGPGWLACEEALQVRFTERLTVCNGTLLPHALDVLKLAEQEFSEGRHKPAFEVMPVYLRDKVALTEKERADKKQ